MGATDACMDPPWIRLVPSRAFCQLRGKNQLRVYIVVTLIFFPLLAVAFTVEHRAVAEKKI